MHVGIIGAGGIANKVTDTLQRMEEADAYAIASRSLEKAEDFARRHGVPRAYGSYEALLDDLVGEEFLTDFMGSVYRSVGVSYENIERVYAALAAKYRDEPWKPTIHAEAIRTDAKELLSNVGLDPELPVWEIQPEDEEILLLILGEEERLLARTEGEPRITAAEVRSELCTGLFQAACFAKRNRVSLARLLLEA